MVNGRIITQSTNRNMNNTNPIQRRRRRTCRQSASATTPTAAAAIALLLCSTAVTADVRKYHTHNTGNNNVVVVQPSNLGSAHVPSMNESQPSSNNNVRGAAQSNFHAWPHPDTFKTVIIEDEPPLSLVRRQSSQKKALQSQPNIEYYFPPAANTAEMTQSETLHVASYLPEHEARQYQKLQRLSQQTQSEGVANAQDGALQTQQQQQQQQQMPSLDTTSSISSKQVILRPRPTYSESSSSLKTLVLPPLGSSGSVGNASDKTASSAVKNQVVYYYDVDSLQSTGGNTNNDANGINGEEGMPELTLPEVVYDASGKKMKLEDVHDGGRNEVFLEVRPMAVWGEDWKSNLSQSLSLESLNDKLLTSLNNHHLTFNPNASSSDSTTNPQSQDQMIVFGTVATMAMLVGALSARRLKSKKLLEHCLEPDLEEDDWDESLENVPRSNKKWDGESSEVGGSVAGLSSFGGLMGGRKGSRAYDTFGGNIHFRGDMEKFDV